MGRWPWPTLENYRTRAEVGYLIRRFLSFGEDAADRIGVTPHQHQALLEIKGARSSDGPTIGELAERLGIQHHSAVELVDRLKCSATIWMRNVLPHENMFPDSDGIASPECSLRRPVVSVQSWLMGLCAAAP